MDILSLVMISFIILESANVLALYFNPGTKNFNGVGVFKAWEESKAYPEIHRLVRYLVYWVAGTKLIFILLLVVVLISARDDSKLLAAIALVAGITSFFWKLFPLIRRIDRDAQIEPPDYSKTLVLIILAFIVAFLAAIGATLLL